MEIDFEKFEKAQDYVNLYIFFNLLIQEGKANFGEKSNKVIEFGHDASNYFSFGRDENQKPFIAVEDSFNPWFFNIDWKELALSINDKESKIYLIARDKTGALIVAIGLKIKSKRAIVLFDPINEDPDNIFCNIKMSKIGEKKEVLTSYNNIITGLKINIVSNIYDIVSANKTEEISFDKNILFIKNKK